MRCEFVSSIHAIAPSQWQQLWSSSYPFLQHSFLALLEDTGCTIAKTGWQPHHLLVWLENVLIGAMPLFIKNHSYGEYVFDWGWAEAYQRHRLPYYPKLINAAPFTPATGPRIAASQGVLGVMDEALLAELVRLGASGWHSLFPAAGQLEAWPGARVRRLGCQFHWFNQGFADFDHFVGHFNSRKRKTLVRERRKAQEAGLVIETRSGSAIEPSQWQAFYRLYESTYHKRSGRSGYLTAEFFRGLSQALQDQVHLVGAYRGADLVAGALYFSDDKCLYGRYWGALVELDSLHFECCYYRGVELALRLGLERFDPGAQGEHKIARGFTPVLTQSYHYLAQPDFYRAVQSFCEQEQVQVERYCLESRGLLPFRDEFSLVTAEQLLVV